MPLYEYVCKACDHEFEREQSISEDPVKTCPKCKAQKAKRLISRTSFVLKGGGWYSDLYSSNSDKKKDAGDAKEASSGGGSDASPKKSKKDSKKSDSKSGGKKSGKGTKAAAA